MFTMMNDARLGVGMQGLGLAEIARQSAVEYARERLQGRSISGTQHEDKPADPIIVHPDVRRMLLTMRAFTEGARAMAAWIARHIDLRDRATDADARQASDDLVQLLTPIVKVYFSDGGFEIANLCIQVYGGHGYIRDTGVEQYARDARIAQIYEGANGIQALDLVGRKLPAHMGRYLRRFFHPVQAWIDDNTTQPELHPFVLPLAKAFGRLQIATGQIAQSGLKNPDEAGAVSTDYLKLFGLVAFAYLWARMAKIGLDHQTDDEADFYAAKVATARFFMDKILPQTGALFSSIMAGSGSIIDFPEASF